MNVQQLTRALVDIESVTPNEKAVGEYLFAHLSTLARAHNGKIERLEAETDRNNVLVYFDQPTVTFSTHMDTVPPFFPSHEDADHIWGRGACDTKGIIAAMITAVENLLQSGRRNLALLFVVGEERNSVGAYHMAKHPRGSKFLINGEPTENRLAIGSKGALRFEVVAHGRMAHSAYPELGESAIEKLLDALEQVRRIGLPHDAILGQSTLNIGTISGGRAPNVIPDQAKAEIFVRLVDDGNQTRQAMKVAVGDAAEANEVLCIPALKLGSLDGFETTVVSYTTDIPAFGESWGQPFLIGPGTIHLAHTSEERISKKELEAAVPLYESLAAKLLQ